MKNPIQNTDAQNPEFFTPAQASEYRKIPAHSLYRLTGERKISTIETV